MVKHVIPARSQWTSGTIERHGAIVRQMFVASVETMLAEDKRLPPPQRLMDEVLSAKNDLSVIGKACQHSPNELAFGIRMQGLESLTHDTGVGLLGVIPDRETELTQLY